MQAGDRAVLRDPGQQSVVGGVQVLDPDPAGRCAGAGARPVPARPNSLPGRPAGRTPRCSRPGRCAATELLQALGITVAEAPGASGRPAVARVGQRLGRMDHRAGRVVDEHASRRSPAEPWLTEDAARRALGLPDGALLSALAVQAGLHEANGRLGRPDVRPALGAASASLDTVLRRLAANPFDSPGRDELLQLGLGPRDLAAAERTGRLVRLAPDLVVASDALARAAALLNELPQPFTASQARHALGTTRRVALPLLETLDRRRTTVRHDAELRSVHLATQTTDPVTSPHHPTYQEEQPWNPSPSPRSSTPAASCATTEKT